MTNGSLYFFLFLLVLANILGMAQDSENGGLGRYTVSIDSIKPDTVKMGCDFQGRVGTEFVVTNRTETQPGKQSKWYRAKIVRITSCQAGSRIIDFTDLQNDTDLIPLRGHQVYAPTAWLFQRLFSIEQHPIELPGTKIVLARVPFPDIASWADLAWMLVSLSFLHLEAPWIIIKWLIYAPLAVFIFGFFRMLFSRT